MNITAELALRGVTREMVQAYDAAMLAEAAFSKANSYPHGTPAKARAAAEAAREANAMFARACLNGGQEPSRVKQAIKVLRAAASR